MPRLVSRKIQLTMKLQLTYVAIDTDASPPRLLDNRGFRFVASIDMLEKMLKEVSRIEEELLRILKEH